MKLKFLCPNLNYTLPDSNKYTRNKTISLNRRYLIIRFHTEILAFDSRLCIEHTQLHPQVGLLHLSLGEGLDRAQIHWNLAAAEFRERFSTSGATVVVFR